MEAIIFCGIQAVGKSSFYRARFFKTHMRLSLDMLNTRNKEDKFLQTCFLTQQRFVVDNTNPTADERLRYIALAHQYKYRVIGYYFRSNNFNDLPAWQKRGIGIYWQDVERIGVNPTNQQEQIVIRRHLVSDINLPMKFEYEGFILNLINTAEEKQPLRKAN